MPAKKEIKPEYAQLSLKIDKKLSDDIEKYWRLNLYQDKTSFVREALDFYINAVKCEHCGAMNPKGSKYCAVCNTPLRDYKDSLDELTSVISKCEERIHACSEYREDLENNFNRLKYNVTASISDPFDDDFQGVLRLLNYCEERIKSIGINDKKEADTYYKYYMIGRNLLEHPTNNGYIIHECVTNNEAFLIVIESKIQEIETIRTVMESITEIMKKIEDTKTKK